MKTGVIVLTLLALAGTVGFLMSSRMRDATHGDGIAEALLNEGKMQEDGVRILHPENSLKTLIEKYTILTFVSRGGKLSGTDSDTMIILSKDGHVTLTELGFGRKDYEGTYTLEDEQLRISVSGYPSAWPKMNFKRVGDACFLYPDDGKMGFRFGGRSGSFQSSEMKPFWPFGLLMEDVPAILYNSDKEFEQAAPSDGVKPSN